MHKNIGIFREDEFIQSLHNKKFGELNNNLRHMLKDMFGILYDTNIIHSERVMGFLKPDVFVECRGKIHFVSLKSGKATTVHQEDIKSFILYLRSKGISVETQRTLLLYQFGGGTMDGSGKERYSFEELNYKMREKLIAANKELNANKDFVVEFVERCMFIGVIDPEVQADYIYNGTVNYGVLCSRKQIVKHLQTKNWNFLHCPHIGPLIIRPHARYVGTDIKNEASRRKVDFYWTNFSKDLEYISDRYDG